MIRLRSYQTTAVARVFEEWKDNQSTLIVLPTGAGKTVCFASIIKQALATRGGRAMVVAHREELIWQAADKIKAVTGIEAAIEMADYRADVGIFNKASVVVSTVQSLNAKGRMEKFKPGEFSVLIPDECHHGVADSWKRVINHFCQNPDLRVCGVTATPDRADEAALGQVFDSVAFQYGLLDAIEDGWLCPIEQRMVNVEGLDLSAVHTTGGDLNGAELAAVMETEQNLHEIAGPTMELIGDKLTLVFAASVAHAERLAEIFNRHRSGCADWICGATPKDVRRKVLGEFGSGKLQIVCNVGVMTEGYDNPAVEVVVMARPTKSRSLYSQMAGRATRPLPGVVDRWELADDRRMAIAESEKPACQIIDFVGNSGKHKLVTTADILGGEYDDEVVERAAKKAAEAGKAVDMVEALKESMAEIHAEKEREKALEAARRNKLRVKASYSTHSVDPFDVFQIEPHREMGWDAGKPLTEKMQGILEKQGIDVEGMNYAQARQLLNEVFRRWDSKECSYKQAKLLSRYGLDPKATRDQAKEWIDKIASNNWKLPPDLAAMQPPVEVF